MSSSLARHWTSRRTRKFHSKNSFLWPATFCHQRLFLSGRSKVVGDRIYCSTTPKYIKVYITYKEQLEPLEVLCVKFEDNRTSRSWDMLQETKCSWTAQRCNIIQSFLWSCVLNSDENISICLLSIWKWPTYQILLPYVIFFKSYK